MRLFGWSTQGGARRDERRARARCRRPLKRCRAIALGASVALLVALTTGVASNAAFADSVVDGCTIVSNPTATHFTRCPGANLARANLSGLNLSYADLFHASLAECQFQLQPPFVTCVGADLSGANLVGANLNSAVTSTCVSLDFGDGIGVVSYCGGVSMPNSNLHDADLTGDNFSFAFLQGANLTGAKLGGTLFGECAPFSKLDFLLCSGANLAGADLAGVDLSGHVLSGANLEGADLAGANLSGAQLSFLFPELGLFPTDLKGADLRGANLRGADLTAADLTDANLTHANLTSATLTAVTWSHTTCPDGTNSDNDGNTCVGHLHSLNGNIFATTFKNCNTLHVGYNQFDNGTIVHWNVSTNGVVGPVAFGQFTAVGGGTLAAKTYHFLDIPLGTTLPSEATGIQSHMHFHWAYGGTYAATRDPGC